MHLSQHKLCTRSEILSRVLRSYMAMAINADQRTLGVGSWGRLEGLGGEVRIAWVSIPPGLFLFLRWSSLQQAGQLLQVSVQSPPLWMVRQEMCSERPVSRIQGKVRRPSWSVCLSVFLSVPPAPSLFFVCLNVPRPIGHFISVCLPVRLFVSLSVCRPVCLLSDCLSTRLSVCPYVVLSALPLSFFLSYPRSVCVPA